MKRKMIITIDTEMDSDIHWKKKFPPEYTSVQLGIPNFLRPIWQQYDVHPIYFVSPEVLYDAHCCEVLKSEIEKGALIGAHLHPEYIEPHSIWGKEMGKVIPQFPCYACDSVEEKEKIKNLTDLIEKKLNVRPVWYRAARFGADIDTIKIIHDLGYLYDSSVTPNIDWSIKGGPNHSVAPQIPYKIGESNLYSDNVKNETGITEYPVCIKGKRWGILGTILPNNWLFYRWLRPTHMTFMEQKKLIRESLSRNEECLVMMFHSMEVMINKTPYVRNKLMQKYYLYRLRKTIEYAKNQGYQL